ncbi:MAG: nucleotide exchange factor GrpE [Acidobacteriota bacterium]
MDPNKEIENIGEIADAAETEETVLVDDFIRQLEAKEKDLHINADTTIEIEESFDDGNLPDFIKEDLQIEKVKPSVATAPAPAPAKKKIGNSADVSFEKEIAGLKEKISQMQAEREELVQTSQRRAKDFENFKSRTERERNETFQNQIGNLATQMLPALDNLNRAVDFALAMPDEQRTGIQPFLDGVMLVSQQVNDVLAEMGIQQIATVGEVFDPHFHEAVVTEESDKFDSNTVSAELLRGYRIGNRVIRHSMVKVTTTPRSEDSETDDPVTEVEEEAVEQVESQENESPDHA